ncbi:MAG: hypothetical protein CMJ72_08900 [Planctomycetaceae bacterium]|nr:hypothetical protein [Planctomycetaceae bacterium]HCK40388.1 DUF423 domain-containing protein [Planctomycetaceae bacterium]|tara:strand:- start:150 stop:563 length:414 start_codon:yes stop_codon:yes gene_type:complete
MPYRLTIILASLLAATGVACGAFAAHGLDDFLASLGYQEDFQIRLDWFDTAVRYQMIHAMGLFLVGILSILLSQPGMGRFASGSFLLGCLLFSGSLYVMAFAPPAWTKLGAIVPLGGIAFIVGWTAIAYGAWQSKKD